jgi:hypothetical protein
MLEVDLVFIGMGSRFEWWMRVNEVELKLLAFEATWKSNRRF